MRFVLLLLAALLVACPPTSSDDDDSSGDDDDAADDRERGPLSGPMVEYDPGAEVYGVALCTDWTLSDTALCDGDTTYGVFGYFEQSEPYFLLIASDDNVATSSHGTVQSDTLPNGQDEIIELPADTDIDVTSTNGVEMTFQLVWNEGESTYDVEISSLRPPE